jgi:hypothetical protein
MEHSTDIKNHDIYGVSLDGRWSLGVPRMTSVLLHLPTMGQGIGFGAGRGAIESSRDWKNR